MLFHKGERPLQNVQLDIQDFGRRQILLEKWNKGDQNKKELKIIFDKTTYFYDFPVIYPNSAAQIFNFPLEPGQEEINLHIWIRLSNGTYFETLYLSNFIKGPIKKHLELKLDNKIIELRN